MDLNDDVLDFLRADLQQFETSSRCPSRGGEEQNVHNWCGRRERREVLQQLRDGDQRRQARREALQLMDELFNEKSQSSGVGFGSARNRSELLDDGLIDPRVNAAALLGDNRGPRGALPARRRGCEEPVFSTPLTSRLLEPEQHPALCRRPSRRGAEAPASFGGFDADCGDLGGDDCGASARREGGPVPLRRSSEEPFLAPAAPAHREPQAGLAEDAVGASNRDAIVERALADRVVALETPSQMCSARCDRQNAAAFGVCSTLPAPQMSCRVTKNGSSTSEIRENSPARTMR